MNTKRGREGVGTYVCIRERGEYIVCIRERETEGTNAVFVTIFGKDFKLVQIFFRFPKCFSSYFASRWRDYAE